MFNYKDFLYIKTIAEEKSISKAAAKLYISQPSLSQTIQKIEEGLGTQIFNRSSQGVNLTFAGKKYYETALKVLSIYNDFTNDISYINNLQKGTIHVGATTFLGTMIFPEVIIDFNRKYPNIEIYITEGDSKSLEKKVENFEVDLALSHYHPLRRNSAIEYNDLYCDRFVVVTEKNSPVSKYSKLKDDKNYLSLIDLKDEEFILLRKDRGIRRICDIIFDEAKFEPKIKLTTTNFETAKRLAIRGYGITIMPHYYLKIFNEDIDYDYYFIDSEEAYWIRCLCANPNMYKSKITLEFIKTVEKFFKE